MIRLKRRNNHTIDIFFIFGLFVLFAAILFFLIAVGSRHYLFITGQSLANHENRAAISYLSETFNQNDSAGSIEITEINGIPSIALKQPSKESFIKYIFAYEGYLRELIVSEGSHFSPSSGEKIAKTASLAIQSYGSHLYCFTLTDTYGNTCPVFISWNAK